jgi:flagellar hook-associated protein 1 FlgK
MGGIGLVLDLAKDALLSHKFAMDVTSHNIANVDTEGYTRQTPMLEAKLPAAFAGVMLGRGVTIDEVVRNTNTFIEARLRENMTGLEEMEQKEIYLSVLEGIFNENSGQSISTHMSDFWNAWQDLVNNPSGLPERNILFETGSLLAQSFKDISEQVYQLKREVNLSIDTGIEKINQLVDEVAGLNEQIVSVEITGKANDLRDKRDILLQELAGYLDINVYEQPDGDVTVLTEKGFSLVSRADAYHLSRDGDDISWAGSGASHAILTDTITGGKLGAWLDLRDETFPKYNSDFNELANTLIWEVNKVHAQGAGIEGFSSLTGAYDVAAGNEGTALGSSGLAFEDEIIDDGTGSFNIWIYDGSGNLVGGMPPAANIAITGATTLNSLAAAITAVDPDITATVTDGKLAITGTNDHTFAFSDDSSNVLAALGINTFFTGDDASNMGMASSLEVNKSLMAAGKVSTTGEVAVGDNTNALDLVDLQDTSFTMNRWTYERGESPVSQSSSNNMENFYHVLVGSIGIESQSITRTRDYNEVIVNQLSQSRDNISAVSLDEEMTQLIKFQHAYAAAAKLVSVADEMFQTLLQTR